MNYLTKDKRMLVYGLEGAHTDIFVSRQRVMVGAVKEIMLHSIATIIVGMISKRWNRTGSYCAR